MKNILILSALEEKERQILLTHLTNKKPAVHPETGTDYYEGTYNGYRIILGRTDQTNVNAGIETERAINLFKPDYIFFVGVAGALKDATIGDIVIGQDVYGYERGKADEEQKSDTQVSVFKPRPKFGASSYAMERAATNFAFSSQWSAIASGLVNKKFHEEVKVYTGTIASGEKVDASLRSELHKFLAQNCSHALAVEMEGLGFLEVCRAYPNIQTLLIRGISDKVDNKGQADNAGSQEYASHNAAAFTFALVETLSLDKKEQSSSDNLLDIMCKLYPEGVKDSRIWLRAGGDLSRLQLQSTGMDQWVDAIDLIEKGGTDIDFDSLLAIVKKDFPNADLSLRA